MAAKVARLGGVFLPKEEPRYYGDLDTLVLAFGYLVAGNGDEGVLRMFIVTGFVVGAISVSLTERKRGSLLSLILMELSMFTAWFLIYEGRRNTFAAARNSREKPSVGS